MSALVAQMSSLSLSRQAVVVKPHAFKASQTSQFVHRSPALLPQTSYRIPLKVVCARVAGVEIPNKKFTEYSLQYIYGIGATTAKAIVTDTGLGHKKIQELSEEELTILRDEVEKYTTEGDLRRFVNLNIKRLKEIGSYRGKRHIASLPCRGQKTKTNARTRKGRAKAIAGKKK